MGALPLEVDRCARGADPVQRHAVIAGSGDTQALGRKVEGLDGAFLGKLLDRSVGKPHIAGLANRVGDGALRPGCDDGNPFARYLGKFGDRAVVGDPQYLAVFAARDQRLVGAVLYAGE